MARSKRSRGTDAEDERPDGATDVDATENAGTSEDGVPEAAGVSEDIEGFDAFDEEIGASPESSRRARAKDPVPAAAKDPVRRSGAKDRGSQDRRAQGSGGSRSRQAAQEESARTTTRRRVPSAAPNPAWLVPTALALLVIGLLYLVAYYLSGGTLPLPIKDWNLLVGFAIMIAGGILLMRWR